MKPFSLCLTNRLMPRSIGGTIDATSDDEPEE
jgi:hypothetical protein